MSTRRPTRTKTLLAIAFAGGLLSAQLPVFAEEQPESSEAVIQRIVTGKAMTPDIRAIRLIQLAQGYLMDQDKTLTERGFAHIAEPQAGNWLSVNTRIEQNLVLWSERVSAEKYNQEHAINPSASAQTVRLSSNGNAALADAALKEASKLLDKSSNECVKLNMYFIVSLLYQKMGRTDQYRKYNSLLEQAFESCSAPASVDETQISVASSVLNSMAYGVIPVDIPMKNPRDSQSGGRPSIHITEAEFQKSRKLKLRAVALVDRLDATSDVRRRVHRDLTVWYMQLGKMKLAQTEKQTLFKLVGCSDDSILYPHIMTCGQFLWWQKERPTMDYACGMG